MSSSEQGDAWESVGDAGPDPAGASRRGLSGRATAPPFLTVCAWCERVRLEWRWLPMDEAVRRLDMVELPDRLLLTHGICPTCLEPLIACRTGVETVLRQDLAA